MYPAINARVPIIENGCLNRWGSPLLVVVVVAVATLALAALSDAIHEAQGFAAALVQLGGAELAVTAVASSLESSS
jgi:hypothetical protein